MSQESQAAHAAERVTSHEQQAERKNRLSAAKQALLAQRLRGEGVPSPVMAKAARPERRLLSFGQERLWFLHLLEPQSTAYNLFVALGIKGSLDISLFQRCLQSIVQRHEVLRTTFGEEQGHPFQHVHADMSAHFECIDLRHLANDAQVRELSEVVEQERLFCFDLNTGPLMRTVLVRQQEKNATLLLTMHHIIADQWSREIFIREMSMLYQELRLDSTFTLPDVSMQYADFAEKQRAWLQGEVWERQMCYWQEHLGNAPKRLRLKTDFPEPRPRRFQVAQTHRLVPASRLQQIQQLSRQQGTTLFMTLLTGFEILLAAVSGEFEIVVGTPISNRRWIEVEETLGFFVNTLALRVSLAGNPSLQELLQLVRTRTLEAFEYQDMPFEQIVAALKPERDPGASPFFRVWFVLGDDLLSTLQLPDLELKSLDLHDGLAREDVDLHLSLLESSAGLKLELTYNAALFTAQTGHQLLEIYELIMGQMVAQIEERLDSLFAMIQKHQREYQTMKNRNMKELNLQKFKKATSTISSTNLVKAGKLPTGEDLPLLLQPGSSYIDPLQWIEQQKDYVLTELSHYGAVLFRGFPIRSLEEFESFTRILTPGLLDYHERSTPRSAVQGKIYTSTEYPADQTIPQHNEHSYSRTWPRKLWFYCVTPAEQLGATPLSDSHKVFELLGPEITEKFMRLGVMYVRNYGRGLDLPWQDVFQTEEKAAVEAYCRESHIEFEWLPDSCLRTKQIQPAVIKHPESGELMWFNQAHLFHITNLEPAVRESLLAAVGEENLPRNTFYGDGSPIEPETLTAIRRAFDQALIVFPWQKHDCLLVDNIRVAHGRQPFIGVRKVVVAMAELDAFPG